MQSLGQMLGEGLAKVRSYGGLVWLTTALCLWPPSSLLSTHDLLFLPLFLPLCFLCWEMEDLLCTVPQHLRDLSIYSPLLSSTKLAIEEEKSGGHAPLRELQPSLAPVPCPGS